MDRLMGLTPHQPSSVGSSLIIVNAQKIMVECAINIIANKKGAKMKLEKKMKTAPPKRLQRTNKVRRNFLSKTLAGCRNIRKSLTSQLLKRLEMDQNFASSPSVIEGTIAIVCLKKCHVIHNYNKDGAAC